MPRVCSICTHAQRADIDAALVRRDSLRDIAGRFGVSRSALARHSDEHLGPALAKAQDAHEETHALDVLKQLRAINGACLAILQEARQQRDAHTALKAVDRIQRQIELQAKLLGDLDEAPTVQVAVLTSPEWVATRAALMEALRPYPDAQQAVSRALLEVSA